MTIHPQDENPVPAGQDGAPQPPPRRTLGDLSVLELIESVDNECSGLSVALDRVSDKLDRDESLVLGAYVGSIWARVGVLRGKLG